MSDDNIEDLREEALQNIMSLRHAIKEANDLYYVKSEPVLSDFEYDEMVKTLREYEQEYPEFQDEKSPTNIVGSDLKRGFDKVPHKSPMLSLDNSFDYQDTLKRIQAITATPYQTTPDEWSELRFCIEPKVDGLAISLIYEDRRFVRAVTRGDGTVGDDVTENVRSIVPDTVGTKHPDLDLRGEIYMPLEAFEDINEQLASRGQEPLANPRNAASGALKSYDPRKVQERQLKFILHGAASETLSHYSTWSDFLSDAIASGFKTIPYRFLTKEAVGGDEEKLDYCLSDIKEANFTFPTDGIVIKVRELWARRELGEGNRSPRWAFAYKFAPEEAETTLKEITLQVGRSGAITPVAELEPVTLDGTTVSRATLHNFEDIARKDIRVGDLVTVVKAGEIIPAVIRSKGKEGQHRGHSVVPAERCPSCNSDLVKSGANLYCRSEECPARQQQKFEHFVSRDAMNIRSIGPALIQQLLENVYLRRLSDFYWLTKDQLLELPGVREAKAKRIVEEIDKSRSAGPVRLLYAHGIPHVGRTASKAILKEFEGDLNELFAIPAASDLMGIDGIGVTIAESLFSFIQAKGPDYLNEWTDVGVRIYEAPKEGGSSLEGETWVITGTLSEERSYFKNLLENAGAKVTGSVSKNTTYLLTGEAPGKSKVTKASDLGIPVVNEEQLRERLA